MKRPADLFPGVLRVRSKGRAYHSIRGKPGSTFWREGDSPEGGPDYQAAYLSARSSAPAPRTFDSVIVAYLKSTAFRDLAPRTRADYTRVIDRIRAKFADAPVTAFDRPGIRRVALDWRDTLAEASPRQAQYAWTVLRLIVNFGVDREMIERNRLTGGGSVYSADRAEVIWTEADILAAMQAAPAHVARAIRAAAETGLRPGDLIRLTRANVLPDRLVIRTAKTGKTAAVALTPEMRRIIDTTPHRLLILTNSDGNAWTEEALSKAVTRARRAARLPDRLRLYDLRGTAVTRQVLAGTTLADIALTFGWSTRTAAQMLQTYAHLDPHFAGRVLALTKERSALPG